MLSLGARRGLPWASPWGPVPQAGAPGASCIFSTASGERDPEHPKRHVSGAHPHPSLPTFQDQRRVPEPVSPQGTVWGEGLSSEQGGDGERGVVGGGRWLACGYSPSKRRFSFPVSSSGCKGPAAPLRGYFTEKDPSG